MPGLTNQDLFGQTFTCTCGQTHTIVPREVLYADDAPSRMADLCERAAGRGRAGVLMDARTRDAAGAEVLAGLRDAGWTAEDVLVADGPGGAPPVCDDLTRAVVEPRLAAADLIVPVGSGVLSDLGKWIAVDSERPFVCFATAASMNGYASSNIAPTLRGVKSLMYGRPPEAVAAAPAVLRDAPYELTAAGLGDVLAKSVSSPDWLVNHLLFGDYYCERSVNLVADIEPLYLDAPEDVAARRPQALEALFYGLLLTGAAMTMAGTSCPSSGGEHLISHSLDMMSSLDERGHDYHGRQVGLGTIIASEVYRRVLAVESPEFADAGEGVDRDFWGPLADSVEAEYARKVPRLQAAREALGRDGAWDGLRERLATLVRPPERLRDCLARAGAAWKAEHIGCDRQRVLAALLHAHQMRSRFTVLDLARLTGVLPRAAGDIVAAWA